MLYILSPWDCSSIGQSTALSRRKLRVRAPSVPTNQINTSTHLSIFCEEGDRQQNLIPNRGLLFLFFFSSNKYGNFHSIPTMGGKPMCMSTISVASYSGFQENEVIKRMEFRTPSLLIFIILFIVYFIVQVCDQWTRKGGQMIRHHIR